MGDGLDNTLRALILHGNMRGLESAYQHYGDIAVNEWMIKNQGYYKLRLYNHTSCQELIEAKASQCPALTIITQEMLIKSIHEGNTGVIRVAAEKKCLNELLFYVVHFVSYNTVTMLSLCKKYGADLTAKDTLGNNLLHQLAKAKVLANYSKEQYHPNVQKDYYEWAIEYLLKQGLDLSTKNTANKTPVSIATIKLNYGFTAAVRLIEDKRLPEKKEQKHEQDYPSVCTLI